MASPFPYDAKRDCFTCPVGQTLTQHAILNRENGVPMHVYRAPQRRHFATAWPVRSTGPATRVEAIRHAQRRARDWKPLGPA
jgi:hypothetical protein